MSLQEKILPNQRQEIKDENGSWEIVEGKGELFFERESGPLIHLCTLKKGNLFFGFPDDPHFKVVLIGSEPLSIQRVDLTKESLTQVLEWFLHFAPFFLTYQKEKIETILDPGKKYEIKEKTAFKGSLPLFPEDKREVRFVVLEKGDCVLLGKQELKLPENLPFPLAHGLWGQALNKSSLQTYSTEDIFQKGKLHASIKSFQSTLLLMRKMALIESEQMERNEAYLRKIQDEGVLDLSFKKIGNLLTHEEEWGFRPLSDPHFKACAIIGKKQGIHFQEPKNLEKLQTHFEKVEMICRVSKIGFRSVKLEGEWWKKDSLSLLAFYGEEKKPVALLNRNGRAYVMVDPENIDSQVLVNEEVAKQIQPSATSFYNSFPEKKIDARSLLHFSFSQYKREILSLLLIGIGGGILSLLPPLFNEYLFNKVIRPYDPSLFSQIVWGLLLTTLSLGLFVFVRSYGAMRLMQLVDVKLEPAFWSRLLSLPVSFFRGFTVGNLIQRVFAVTDIRQLIGGNVIRAVFSGIFSFFYFLAMLYYSAPLALVGLGVILFALAISSYSLCSKVKIEREIQAVDGTMRGLIIQLISGVSKIRLQGAEARAFSTWAKNFTEFQDLNNQSRGYDRILSGMTNALPILATGILFSALIIYSKSLSLGAFIAFLSAYVPFSMAVYDMINTLVLLVPVIPLWERAKVLLDTEPESESTKEKPGLLHGEVSLDQVSFQYEKEGNLILDEVTLHAEPGEFVAIVGPSGSGKSTLVRLLLGFEVPLKGSVTYDGKNLSKLDLQDVRRQIGTVLQNGAIFSGSIYENIVCGGLYTQNEITEALALSGFDKDIEAFPMGLHTFVQSGGGTLSVGQAQRLLISRALISKPKILIFDEATSALDNKTQDEVSRRLEHIDVTRIVIAHRLSTIRGARRVYVIEKGKVVQSGSFLDLAQQEGIFKEMLKRQTL